MDKQISKKEQQKNKIIKLLKFAVPAALLICAIAVFADWSRPEVKLTEMRIATADVGTIESTIPTSGIIKPAIEEDAEASEREAIINALAASNGKIARAATILGISRPTLYRRIEKYGIKL